MKVEYLFIVESRNDEAFIRIILKDLLVKNAEIFVLDNFGFETLHHIEATEFRGKKALDERLERLKGQLQFGNYQYIKHLSIILDADSPKDGGGLPESIKLVNQAFGKGLKLYPEFTAEGQFRTLSLNLSGENFEFSASCFFLKTENGEGHLDTVLKAIACKSAPESECLEALWLPCVEGKTGKGLSNFEKLWINFYVRAHATSKQKGAMEEKFPEVIEKMGAEIFNLNHPVLNDLKAYLKSFSN